MSTLEGDYFTSECYQLAMRLEMEVGDLNEYAMDFPVCEWKIEELSAHTQTTQIPVEINAQRARLISFLHSKASTEHQESLKRMLKWPPTSKKIR